MIKKEMLGSTRLEKIRNISFASSFTSAVFTVGIPLLKSGEIPTMIGTGITLASGVVVYVAERKLVSTLVFFP